MNSCIFCIPIDLHQYCFDCECLLLAPVYSIQSLPLPGKVVGIKLWSILDIMLRDLYFIPWNVHVDSSCLSLWHVSFQNLGHRWLRHSLSYPESLVFGGRAKSLLNTDQERSLVLLRNRKDMEEHIYTAACFYGCRHKRQKDQLKRLLSSFSWSCPPKLLSSAVSCFNSHWMVWLSLANKKWILVLCFLYCILHIVIF